MKKRKYIPNNLPVNEQIPYPAFTVIGSDGTNYGVLSYDQAMIIAYDTDVDVVLVNPDQSHPVAKLIDFGKYQYEIEKKERKQRSKQHAGEVKEIKLSYRIDEHDFLTKLERAKQFLDEGLKVKLFLPLFGRENIFTEKAFALVERFKNELSAIYESEPQKIGNRIIAILRRPTSKPGVSDAQT